MIEINGSCPNWRFCLQIQVLRKDWTFKYGTVLNTLLQVVKRIFYTWQLLDLNVTLQVPSCLIESKVSYSILGNALFRYLLFQIDITRLRWEGSLIEIPRSSTFVSEKFWPSQVSSFSYELEYWAGLCVATNHKFTAQRVIWK